MKKWLLAFMILLVIAVSCFYLLIPSEIRLSQHRIVDCSISAANRFVLDPAKWTRWWPGKQVAGQGSDSGYRSFQHKTFTYTIKRLLYNRVQLTISEGETAYTSFLQTISFSRDTMAVEWQFNLHTSLNPIKRFQQLQQSKRMKENVTEVLASLQGLLHDKEKVYGIKMQRILNGARSLLVVDSNLTYWPDTKEVYQTIAQLRQAVKGSGAVEINYPMLHISRSDSGKFFMMVAVQTNIQLNRVGHMYYKHTYPGYTLLSQVQGGPGKIAQTIAQMHTYIQDYQIVSPAIPYAEMVTDRMKEIDTSKWVSRIYYPVF